jgi:hypothetical protein
VQRAEGHVSGRVEQEGGAARAPQGPVQRAVEVVHRHRPGDGVPLAVHAGVAHLPVEGPRLADVVARVRLADVHGEEHHLVAEIAVQPLQHRRRARGEGIGDARQRQQHRPPPREVAPADAAAAGGRQVEVGRGPAGVLPGLEGALGLAGLAVEPRIPVVHGAPLFEEGCARGARAARSAARPGSAPCPAGPAGAAPGVAARGPRLSPAAMTAFESWAERKRAELPQIARLDPRQVTPSVRDIGASLRMGRRDLCGIPVIAADATRAAELYARAAAADASLVAVLTDAAQGGSLSAMRAVSDAAGSTPVLRLDLVLHESQVYETRLAGGDATLLPVGLLAPGDLSRLVKTTRSTRMVPVFLVRSEAEWGRAEEAGARFAVVAAEQPDGAEDHEAAVALCARLPASVSVTLWSPRLTAPGPVQALLGKVDGALLAPGFPAERWPEVVVVE